VSALPPKQGLYDPRNEHDSCGVGFVVDIKNRKSHRIIQQGLEILLNLDHRGAVGADPLAGDGSGILLQKPDGLFRAVAPEAGIDLPDEPDYAAGSVFLPRAEEPRAVYEALVERIIREEGQQVAGWRTVPVASEILGPTVSATEPVVRLIAEAPAEASARGLVDRARRTLAATADIGSRA